MKFSKYLFTIACILFVQDVVIAADKCDNTDDPEIVRVYFANGMSNEPKDIEDNKIALEKLVGVSSNYSFGKSENTKEAWYIQLLEVFAGRETEASKFWEWLSDMSLAPQWFQNAFNNYLTLISEVSYALDGELRIMINEYLQDLNSGKKVVIVSHSQGNFYANAAYQYIRDNYSKYKNSIGIVAVGTPAGRVQDGGPHTTNSKDFVVNLVRTRYYVLPATGTYDEPRSFLNHNFIDTYIAGFGSAIKNDVIQTISRLETPEKDFECKDPSEVPVNVNTTFAGAVSFTSARLHGYVESGKQIAGHCIWRKAANGDPATCWAYRDSIATSGTLDTGEDFYCTANGLLQNTSYKYRVCGREGDRISDGGVKSFKTNISCGTPLSANGGTEGLSVNFGMGAAAGYAQVEFEAYNIPDKLEIWHGGSKIYTTNGYVSGFHSSSVYHNPSYGQEWEIQIYGNSNTGTAWELEISCPQ